MPITRVKASTTAGALAQLDAVNEAWIKAMGRSDFDASVPMVFYLIVKLARRDAQDHAAQSEVFARSGMSEAAVSRNIAILGRGSSVMKPGPRLIESIRDSENRRKNIIRLTPKGRSLVTQLEEIVQ